MGRTEGEAAKIVKFGVLVQARSGVFSEVEILSIVVTEFFLLLSLI